jgi:predicted acetyltransferase
VVSVGRGVAADVQLIETTRAALDGELEAKVLRLLGETFFDDAATDYYARLGIPATILILRDGQEVAGHLALYRRDVGILDEQIEIGLLGGVAVAPDRRGRGNSRTLVRRAHARLRERSIPFSILFAFEPRVYASSGYKPMQNPTRFLAEDCSWSTFVYRGGMYAELLDRAWPNQLVDLRGPVV